MKIALLVCSIFCVAFAAEKEEKDNDIKAVLKTTDDCLEEEMNATADALCPDYDRLIGCFKTLEPIDDQDKNRIEEFIRHETERRDECPALLANGTCAEYIRFSCMEDLYKDIDFQCGNISTAKKCLEDLNAVCGKNVTTLEMEELEYEQWACDNGEHKIITDLDTHSSKTIVDCYVDEYSKTQEKECVDHASLIKCLRRLVPKTDDESMAISDHVLMQIDAMEECPEYLANGTCIHHERSTCMDGYYHFREKGGNPCPAIQAARECLKKHDVVCGKNVSALETEELDHQQSLCDAGYFGNGTCSEQSLYDCTVHVFYLDNGVMNCGKKVVEAAKDCLMKMKSDCKSPFIQREVSDELDYLVQDCANDFADGDLDDIFE